MIRRPPRSPLFPYSSIFRSLYSVGGVWGKFYPILGVEMFKIKSVSYIWAAGPNYFLHTKNHENRTFLSVFILLGEFGVNFTPFWGFKCSKLSRCHSFGLLVLITTYIPKITKIVHFCVSLFCLV